MPNELISVIKLKSCININMKCNVLYYNQAIDCVRRLRAATLVKRSFLLLLLFVFLLVAYSLALRLLLLLLIELNLDRMVVYINNIQISASSII